MIIRNIFLIISLLAAFPAAAIVSMESLHLGKPEPGWSGSFELSASGASGNTEKYDAVVGTRLQWYEGRNTSFLLLNAQYGRNSGETDTDNRLAHFRQIRDLTERTALEGFLQLQNDRFIRLEYRDLAGGGFRFSLLNSSQNGEAYLGLGAFYEREQLTEPEVAEKELYRTWRANTYLVLKYKLGDHSSIISSTYYQPGLSETEDYRLLEDLGITVDINSRVALTLGLNARHDSLPPQGVEKTDIRYRAGFVYRF